MPPPVDGSTAVGHCGNPAPAAQSRAIATRSGCFRTFRWRPLTSIVRKAPAARTAATYASQESSLSTIVDKLGQQCYYSVTLLGGCGHLQSHVLSGCLHPQGLGLPPRKKQDMDTKVVLSHEQAQSPSHSSIAADGVRYTPHSNGGGLVASTASVGAHVYVAPGAIIRDSAVVTGATRLFGRARVEGHAIVIGACTLRDDASVAGDAVLRGSVTMVGFSRVEGQARVSGSVRLEHRALIAAGTVVGSFTIR